MATFTDNPDQWKFYMSCHEAPTGCPSKKVRNNYINHIGRYKEFLTIVDLDRINIRDPYKQEFIRRFIAWQNDDMSKQIKGTLLPAWGINVKSGWHDIVMQAFADAKSLCINDPSNCQYLYTNGKKFFDSEDAKTIKQNENKLIAELFDFYGDSEDDFEKRNHKTGDSLVFPKYGTWHSMAKIFYNKGYNPDLWDSLIESYHKKLASKLKQKRLKELHKEWEQRHQEWLDNQKETQAKHEAWLKAQAAAQAQAQAAAQAQAQAAAQAQAGGIPLTPSGFTNVEPPLTSVGKPKSKNQLILVVGGALVLGVAIYEFVIKKR